MVMGDLVREVDLAVTEPWFPAENPYPMAALPCNAPHARQAVK